MKQLWKTGLLLLFAATFSGALWLPGTEIVYDYHATLDTSTKYPVESTSQWTMKGKLVVQGDQDFVTVQLQDVKISTYTGPSNHNASVVEIPPPEEASQLLQPFILHFVDGKLVALSVKAGEDEWTINMKRGIAGLLQLHPEALHFPTSTLTENGLHGNCKVEYSSRNFTNNTLSITKIIDFSTCHGSKTHGISGSHELCPAGHPKTAVDVVSVRLYTLEPLGSGGEYVISSATADGGIYFQPFKYQSEAFYIWTWMELKLEKVGATKNPLVVKGGGEKVGLKYVLPAGDVSQGRSLPTQEELISVVIKMLHEMGESLNPPGLEKNLTRLHEERVAHILYFLSLLNHESLNQLYSDLAVGTSYQHETFRNLFIELLSLVGSHDAALLIRDLAMGGTLKNDTAVELLIALPFSLRHPSQQLLKDFEVILTLPEDSALYSSAILTFATLVNWVCHSDCGSEVQDKYVGQYLDLFRSSDTFEKQFLYLHALGNFNHKRVAQYFEPIIQGTDTKYSHYIRFLAIWLTENNGYLNSEKAFQLFWPILSNREELLEMRASALIMLTKTHPSVARFSLITSYMIEEPDPHLHHYWYTTLHSLVRTNHPHYRHLSKLAKKAIRFYPEPDVPQRFTGHYIFDYSNPEYGFGSMGQVFQLANPHTGSPHLIMLHFSSAVEICSYTDYALYLRLEGVGDVLKRLNSKDILSVDKLLELLKQLDVPSKQSEPFHVELSLQSQGKIILVHYANETTLNSLFQVLKTVKLLAGGGVHVNAQNIVVPFLLEEMGSTDVGTTALLRITYTWMMSLRANLTAGKSVLNQLDFRSYLSSQIALTQYNPVLNMWHGVQRSLNLQVNVPFDLQFSVQSVKDQIKFSLRHKPGEEAGIIGHVETVVHVRGITAADKLKSHCPGCSSRHVIKSKPDHPSTQELADIKLLGAELKLSLLDCEHSYQKEDLLSLVQHVSEHQNSDMIPSLGPLLTLAHLYDSLILVPPRGSCGLLIKLSPLVKDPTQVDVEITVNKTESSASASGYTVQLLVTSNSSSRWEIDVHYVPSKHRLTTNLSSEDGHLGSLDIHAQFPEAVEEVTFLADKEPHKAQVEINAEWKTLSLQIIMEGEVTSEQQEHATNSLVWPYNTCQKDLHDTEQWGEVYAPLSPACYEVAKELATLRRYNFSVISNNLPPWLNFLPENNVTVHVEVPQDSRATITVNGHKKVLGLLESNKLQPLLINTHFPPLLQLATGLGSVGSCVVTSKSVWTADGVHLDSQLGTCYSLAVADCSEAPQFALFLKKTDSKSLPLALKLYTGDSTLELSPHGRKISITVNELVVASPEQGYQHPPGASNYHFRVWKRSDGLVRIFLPVSHTWIEYYGHFATVTVPGLYRGKLCGLCGNFNINTKDDTVHLYTIPCAT